MNLYKPKELRSFLETHSKKANKGLSQNFLIDKNILDKIIKQNQLYMSFPVLEIGPGPGALTEQLLSTGFNVKAVELDKEFAELLEKRLLPFYPNLSVYQQDFLKLDLAQFLSSSPIWTVIANLPYHISTKALLKLVTHAKNFAAITLMVQKEFYERIKALDGKDYGILNVLLRTVCSQIDGFKVSSTCFYPAPNVDSVVMHLTIQSNLKPELLEKFHLFLKAAFLNRRKKLISNLAALYDMHILRLIFSEHEIDEDARVEQIKPEKYFQLFTSLENCPS